MKSQIFRSLISSLIAAALPLIAQSGCGTCYSRDFSEFPATANVRVRAEPNTCEEFCGSAAIPCQVVITGQSGMTIDCNGMPPTAMVGTSFFASVVREDCAMICDSATTCGVSNSVTDAPGKNFRACDTSYSCPKTGIAEGRRPAELVLADCTAQDEVGAFFAAVMQLEAASVDAFDILAEELRAHAAPPSLILAAEQARGDEVRHTRMSAALMRRFAATAPAPTVTRRAVRPLLALALENAVEGCVREAYGAFLASWQAEAATDAVVRKTMRRIAPDEVRHAELAFAIAEWADGKLTAAERALVAAARARAVEELLNELAHPLSLPLQTTAGLPPPELAQRFVLAQASIQSGESAQLHLA